MSDEELRAGLKPTRLGDDEVAEMVGDAQARDASPSRGRFPLTAVAAAAVLLIGVTWIANRPDPEPPAPPSSEHAGDEGGGDGDGPPNRPPPPGHDVAAEEVRQRGLNQAYFDSEAGQAAIAAVPDGHWISIERQELVHRPTLDALLEKMGTGRDYHRFIFQKGEEGDRTYNATFVDAPWAGTKFMAQADLGIDSRLSEKFDFTPPDGRPWLPIGRHLRVVLSTGSACPLLVPEFRTNSRYEIPGLATVKLLIGQVEGLRRRLLRVQIPELEIDGWFEAVEVPDIGRLRAGERDWAYYDNPERAIRRHVRSRRARSIIMIIGAQSRRAGAWLDEILSTSHDLLDGLPLGYSPFGTPPGQSLLRVVTPDTDEQILIGADSEPDQIRAWLAEQIGTGGEEDG